MTAPEAYIQFKPDLVTDSGDITVASTKEFLRTFMLEFDAFIERVLRHPRARHKWCEKRLRLLFSGLGKPSEGASYFERITQRNPTWQAEVSVASPCLAAGRYLRQ